MSIKVWDTDLIGILAEPEQDQLSYRDSIIINKQDSLQFFVRIISQPADSFPNVKMTTCFYSDLEKWGFEDDYQQPDFIRKEKLREWLEDHLLIFKVERRIRYNHEEVFNALDVRVMPKLPSFHKDLRLIPVPVFSEEVHQLSNDDFVYRLANKKYVGRIENLSHETNDTPSFIMWKEEKEEEDDYKIFGEFEQHHYAHGGFTFEIRESLKQAEVLMEWIDECYISDDVPNLVFVPLPHYQKMTETLENAIPLIITGHEEKTPAFEELAPVFQHDSNELQKALEETAVTVEENTLVNEPVSASNQKESEFLEQLFTNTQDAGLAYQKEDLVNFHTSMKSSSLVILSGMSGTGKTKLVELYGYTLGLKGTQQTIIPVSPSWTSDSDLIGYADTLHMVYRPGDSGLINALRKAEDEPNKLFIICFDEMNLARVEHYFSQFLSILEMEHGKRVLRLYNDDLESRLYNSAQYPPTIVLRENIIFAGTVNVDESTYHFSDKVLDRANVLSLNVQPFNQLKDLPEKKKVLAGRNEEIDYDTFKTFKAENRIVKMRDQELQFLWDFHQAMQEVSKQTGIGPRIVKQIDIYLENLPLQPYITRNNAFDLQIVQRVLTKIRGSEDQLRDLIGKLDRDTGEVLRSRLLELFDKNHEISDFENSRVVIKQKAKELRFNGYTL